MTKLFPKEFISGSITNKTDMNAACLKFPQYSKTFLYIALARPGVRKWYEDRWPQLQKYLDKNFATKFQMESEHPGRAWEFHLGATLLERGFALEKKCSHAGPDFCIKISETQKLWIEAIACDLGNIDPVPHSVGGNNYIDVDIRPRVLRITSAIKTKSETFKKYLQDSRSRISRNDCFVIAVNGEAIEHGALGTSKDLLTRAVFGKGPDTYVIPKGNKTLKGPYYEPLRTVTKKAETRERDVTIQTDFMEVDEFSEISAVIYWGGIRFPFCISYQSKKSDSR